MWDFPLTVLTLIFIMYGLGHALTARAYKFRIYPDATRQEEIDKRLVLAQQFYNKILEKSITSYKNGKTKVSMAQFNRFVKEIIQEDKKYLKLYSQTRCEIEYRLLKAYQNFFRRIKEGNKKVGFSIFVPSEIATNEFSPKSIPTGFVFSTCGTLILFIVMKTA